MKPTVREIDFVLTQVCNYRCSYCWIWGDADNRTPGLHTLHRDLGANSALWERVLPFLVPDPNIHLIGGEVTLFPWFPAMAYRIATDLPHATLHITSNMSRPATARQVVDLGVAQNWNLSYHPEHEPDPAAFYARIEAAGLLGSEHAECWVAVVAWPSHFDLAERAAQHLAERGLVVALQPFSGVFEGRRYPQAYTDDQRARIARAATSIDDVEELDHLSQAEKDALRYGNAGPKACTAGRDYLYINPHGQILRCPMIGEPLQGPVDGIECVERRCACTNLWKFVSPGFPILPPVEP